MKKRNAKGKRKEDEVSKSIIGDRTQSDDFKKEKESAELKQSKNVKWKEFNTETEFERD